MSCRFFFSFFSFLFSQVRSKTGSPTIEAIKDELSFDKGFFLFVRALQMLVKKKEDNGPIIVGLAGPSGAGKTVFSSKVQSLIPGCAVLSMDMYNDASRLVDGNFDDPRLTDTELLLKNIEGLRNGETVQVCGTSLGTHTHGEGQSICKVGGESEEGERLTSFGVSVFCVSV